MADIDLTLAVRNQELNRGLAEAEARVKTAARRMSENVQSGTQAVEQSMAGTGRNLERSWQQSARGLQTAALGGVLAAYKINQKLLRDYAKESAWADDQLSQLEASVARFAKTLGRDLAPQLVAVNELMSSLGAAANADNGQPSWRSFLSPAIGLRNIGISQDLKGALRADEEATAAGRNRLAGGAAVSGAIRQFELDAANTPLQRAQAQLRFAEASARQEAGKTIPGTGLEADQRRAQFVMLRTEALRQEVRLLESRNRLEQEQNERESRKAINERMNKNLGERIEKRDRELAAGRALHLEEQMTKAQELRLRGRDREADKLEVIAQFEKRIRDVADTDFSSPAEADRYRGRLRLLMGDQLRMLSMAAPDRTASIGSGGYSSGIGRVAFGNGLGPGAAGTSHEAELKKANQTLKQIQQQLEKRSGASFN